MQAYEVGESKVGESASGRRVSMFGALPWFTEAQKVAEGWQLVTKGWTVRNPLTGEVGVGHPASSKEEAQALAARLGRPSRCCIGD